MQSSTPKPARGMPCATVTSRKTGAKKTSHTLVLAVRDGFTNDGSSRPRDDPKAGRKSFCASRFQCTCSKHPCLSMSIGRVAAKLSSTVSSIRWRCRKSGRFPSRRPTSAPVVQLLHYGRLAPDRLHSCSGLLPYNTENARSTPLVQPNPIWTGYSPPPPGLSSTRSYFSSNVLNT
jgi:hypothetical protein